MVFNNKNSQIIRPLKKNWSILPISYDRQLGSHDSEDNDDDDSDDDDDEQEDLCSDILGHYNTSYDVIKVKEQNAIKLVLEREAYCFDMKLFAEKFVEAIFIEVNKILAQNEVVSFPKVSATQSDVITDIKGQRETLKKHSSGVKFRNTLNETSESYWPKISQFNINLGLEKIQNYVTQWKRSDDWKFCVEFLGFECEDCSNIFVYEVEWSKPTVSYPVPQATASVYFALEVYKMVPHKYDRSIEVTYIFECSSVIHHPGKINFQEKWLEDIIEAKLKFFKTITFSTTNRFLKAPLGHFKFSISDSFEFLKNQQGVVSKHISLPQFHNHSITESK